MRYTWECQDCKHDTIVERKVADIDVPPEACEACQKTDLKRVIRVSNNRTKGFILEGGGWHDNLYTSTKSRN